MEVNAAARHEANRQTVWSQQDLKTPDSRAPWAVAASMMVLVTGAIFLAYAMGLSSARHPAPDVASAAFLPGASIAPQPAPTVAAPPTGVGGAAQIASADPNDLDPIELTFGSPPRLNPDRMKPAETDNGETAKGETGDGLFPRLKPGLDAAAATTGNAPVADAPSVVRLAGARMADENDGPPPIFFESDLVADRTPPPPPAVAYQGDLADAPREVRVSLAKGETFVDALRRANVNAADRNAAAYSFGEQYNLRTLRPGQEFVLTLAEPNQTLFQLVAADAREEVELLMLDFRVDAETRIIVTRDSDGAFHSEKTTAPLTTRLAAIEGRIDGSLYLSAKRQGAPDEVIAGLADMFAYDIDFQREIFGGDEFEAIFEVRYDEAGRMVGAGDIIFGRMKWRGRAKEKGYYRFASGENGGRSDYFDAKGESARRLLMKTPIDGARLSSGFGTRRHPILGYQKAHKGVDFAAARGTPIKAAGDGVVERAGPYGSFGNYIKIRHANSYKTAYAHLHAIKKGVRSGARVRQGDIIGYVGTTGRSTGPHLHYEVHYKDKQVNPQNLKIATGVELKGTDLANFRLVRDGIDAMRTPHTEADATGLLAESTAKDKAL